jgi:KaiC/GvpD/RAD55 family RecA-like ATPase
VLLGELLRNGIEPTPQLLEDLIYEGRVHSIAGLAGIGKTIFAVSMCLQVMLRRGVPVLYLDAENGPKVIAERLHDMGADTRTLDL